MIRARDLRSTDDAVIAATERAGTQSASTGAARCKATLKRRRQAILAAAEAMGSVSREEAAKAAQCTATEADSVLERLSRAGKLDHVSALRWALPVRRRAK